ADAFYRQALARDPNFAEAAAELARSRLSRHWFVSPLSSSELEEVKSLIDRALALAPNSPEAHSALGSFFYWGHRQYEAALTEFNRTLELQPNNALARQNCAAVYRRRGEWERSLADSQRAQELDPRDTGIPDNMAATCLLLRLWKDAERWLSRALAIDPHNMQAASALLITRLNATGDVDSARRALDGFPEGTKSLTREWFAAGGDVAGFSGIWVYLALGRNADALRLAREAAASIPIEKDAVAGPTFQIGLAQIEARAGAPEEAVKRLRHLLSIPAGQVASIARLRIDPVWDPIRN